jgi:hypothetical protein
MALYKSPNLFYFYSMALYKSPNLFYFYSMALYKSPNLFYFYWMCYSLSEHVLTFTDLADIWFHSYCRAKHQAGNCLFFNNPSCLNGIDYDNNKLLPHLLIEKECF